MTTPVLRYSAFAENADGGNPAGVVLDAAGLSDEQMQQIAVEVGYSETAFVRSNPSTATNDGGADPVGQADGGDTRRYVLRYWSPAAEVPFCGHATVATAVALTERDGPGQMVFDTPAGDIPIVTAQAAAGTIHVAMTSVEPHVRDLAPTVLAQLLDLLGLKGEDLDERFPPREAFAGNWHPILVLQNLELFHQFRFAPNAVAKLMVDQGWTGTVTVLHEAGAGEFLARNLFPVGRITEDPATGSAVASTGAYLRAIGYAGGKDTITIHQGAEVGRPSLLTITVPDSGGITVTGSATRIDAAPPHTTARPEASSNIVSVLARAYVDDLTAALPLYERLTGSKHPHRFDYHGISLANVGAFLLIQGATAKTRIHTVTVNVHDINQVADAITAAGGTLLEGPAPGPNGARLIARHPDGTIIEYIETLQHP